MKEIELLGWAYDEEGERERVIVSMDRNLYRALEKLQGDGVKIMDWARRLIALKEALEILGSSKNITVTHNISGGPVDLPPTTP